ncbi:MAG TPA: polysaccharide pyruvyl transferase CsaB [Clostridia bacterium]|nr:polysaccharide pyruvyl transferase CsaB [Clostridia bacterium]
MKKIFIFGYYGFKNIGDEAILSSIIDTLRKIDPDIIISALSYSAQYTEDLHNIKAISRNNLREIVRAIKEADLVISGGGSLLQDVTSNRSLIYYLGIIYLAKKMNKKVMFYGNGIGPINKNISKYLINRVANKVDMIAVRDYNSLIELKSLGINRNIEVTADATFVLEPVSENRVKEILGNQGIPTDKPLIGVSVRPWKNDASLKKALSKFGDYVTEKNMNILFIPMQPSRDIPVSREICESMKNRAYIIEEELNPREVMGLIGHMDILVGMRLHALIFAAGMSVPMLGIEYDPKVKSFLDIIKQVNLGTVTEIDETKIRTEFDRLWHNRENNKHRLHQANQNLKSKAGKNGILAYNLIK